ncbi:MAG: GAF domain-containing protein, partial [Flavobacteriales bacterium]
MAEPIEIEASSRSERYELLNPQMKGLLEGETNRVANMANFCAALNQTMEFHWVGFYMVEGDELVLGPFQGPVACTRLRRGKGVCAAAWEQGST